MSTVHMDTEDVRRVKRRVLAVHESIQEILRSGNLTFSNLPENWIAPSANQCFQKYSDSITRIRQTLGPLQKIASDLEREVQRFERIARQF